MAGERHGEAPFNRQVELSRLFLVHRREIVDRIQDVLNAQRKPIEYLQDRQYLSRQIEECFFSSAEVAGNQFELVAQLEEAHRASGFSPRQVDGLFNDLINPAEMMIRGFHCWQQTRWPGRNGRVRYAHTLFDLFMIRRLQLLSMRLWDDGSKGIGDRLAQIQSMLDGLWTSAPFDRPALVRDARWLIPLAQSPTTDELAGYFEVAERVADSLSEADRIEVQKAHVQMIGGHLRSQIRHYCISDGVTIEEQSVVRRTRTSNALDFALLIRQLVSLLEAYERAHHRDDSAYRLELASAIFQAVSPDPELFLNRIDLLGAYSMIEHLFIETANDGQVGYSPMGRSQVQKFQQYEILIGRLSQPLLNDCRNFRPVDGNFSPYGAIYGTPTNLIEDMALKTLQVEAMTQFGLEDVFATGGADTDKLAWVNGWRQLPHVDRAVQKLYEYPQQFAEAFFIRIEQALNRCVAVDQSTDVLRTGRIVLASSDEPAADTDVSLESDLPVRFIQSSDPQTVAAGKADACDQTRLTRDRHEGYFVVSYRTSAGWVAIKKDVLTEVLGEGGNARILGLPSTAAQTLKLMCPRLVHE